MEVVILSQTAYTCTDIIILTCGTLFIHYRVGELQYRYVYQNFTNGVLPCS